MANIADHKSIRTNGQYVDLAEVMGITFELNEHYQIQLLNTAMVMIANNKPFGYTHLGQKLWIKSIENKPIEVNISEG